MAWRDFREFLAEVERRGDVEVVEGAACELEIGTICELMAERDGPILLFDRIVGYPAGYRVAAKPYGTVLRSAIALGLPEDVSPFEMFKVWRARLRDYRPLPPLEVATGSVMENVLEGEAVDLMQFPVPTWHELDGGPYLGTGCGVITRDYDSGWVNVGTYRCQRHDGRTTGIDIAPYHHGGLHLRQWWAHGEACPIAVVITPEPYLFCAATNGLGAGAGEYEYAGFLKGEPLEVVAGPRTGLPLPAHAELVLEGEVPPPDVEQRREGPFGEFTGYYAAGQKLAPVIRVQAVYHRTNPILHGDPPLKPPADHWAAPPPGSTVKVWDGLQRCGVPGVEGVFPLNTGGGMITVVSVRQQYAGHARQVGRVASGLVRSLCRAIVVVDADVDPSNPEEVLWAVATRSDPETTWEIEPDCPSLTLDPMIRPEQKERGALRNSRALIVACRPWEWMDAFPAVNRSSDALRRQTLQKWRALFA
jgi:4-hydroxy-3-polyprenylbenzoate decarboxylase